MNQTSKFSDLLTRSLSAVVMILVAGLTVWKGDIYFQILLILASGIMAWEVLRMQRNTSLVCLSGGIGLGIILGFNIFYTNIIFLVIALVLIASMAWSSTKERRNTGIALLCIFLSCFALVQLRSDSIWSILFIFSCVIASDIGGYFAGRLIGGPKFWPTISPKKTWSGTITGWILAGIVGITFSRYLESSLFIPLSIGLAMAAQAGDLAESWMKRRAGIKDSSNLIPGHGGFLDRFDGVIGVGVFAALFLIVTGSWFL